MLFAPKERGQGLVEYALILVMVALVVIVILAILGPAIGNVFSNLITQI
jgi:pilus assembly protein Flp/PilA